MTPHWRIFYITKLRFCCFFSRQAIDMRLCNAHAHGIAHLARSAELIITIEPQACRGLEGSPKVELLSGAIFVIEWL